jgi:hypothetical protein
MHRKKPASAKQRKAKLQLKRAIKRGDVTPETAAAAKQTKTRRPRPGGPARARTASENAIVDSSRKLQSSFVKLSPEFLATTKQLASTLSLHRPIPIERAVFPTHAGQSPASPSTSQSQTISLLKRPKWNYDMSKSMVEKNEEGMFKKWLSDTDAACGTWDPVSAKPPTVPVDNDMDAEDVDDDTMPSSAPLFERNLEVWRQLYVHRPAFLSVGLFG